MCSSEGGGKTVRSAPLLFYVATKCGKRDLAADMRECEGERYILSSVQCKAMLSISSLLTQERRMPISGDIFCHKEAGVLSAFL